MLLVILGAGASYDSVPAYPPAESSGTPGRPPLADGLFENRPLFREAMSRFSNLHPIVPLLQRRQGLSLEQKLQELAREAQHYPARYKQLMAVRYYLQYIFWAGEDPWLREVAGHVTNYRALLDQIDRWRTDEQPVCLVTFNYDRLIEHALTGAGISTAGIADYIASPLFKLFKVHGSINWVRSVQAQTLPPEHTAHQWTAAIAVIENAAELTFSDHFAIAAEYPTGFNERDFVAPAIAIPLEEKTDFECPSDHLSLLNELMPQTDRLLIIWWRATEQHFLRMLSGRVTRPVSSYIVCGDTKAGEETAKRLQSAGIQGEYHVSGGGFTDMISRRELDSFLGNAQRQV